MTLRPTQSSSSPCERGRSNRVWRTSPMSSYMAIRPTRSPPAVCRVRSACGSSPGASSSGRRGRPPLNGQAIPSPIQTTGRMSRRSEPAHRRERDLDGRQNHYAACRHLRHWSTDNNDRQAAGNQPKPFPTQTLRRLGGDTVAGSGHERLRWRRGSHRRPRSAPHAGIRSRARDATEAPGFLRTHEHS